MVNLGLEQVNGDCVRMDRMAASPVYLKIYCVHRILWWIVFKISTMFLEVFLGNRFLVVLIGNGYTRRLTVGLVQVQLVFLQKQSIYLIHGLEFWRLKESPCYLKLIKN